MPSEINYALVRLALRAEDVPAQLLSKTFVNAGQLFARLSSENDQILYGRRGTGKTHALRHLRNHITSRSQIALYFDLRTAGSAQGLYGSTDVPIAERATALLVDVLENLHGQLHSLVTARASLPGTEGLLPLLDSLAMSITDTRVTGQVETGHTATERIAGSREGGVEITVRRDPGITLDSRSHREDESTRQRTVTEKGTVHLRVHLGSVVSPLRQIVAAMPHGRLWLLLDEWSSVPSELQPFLADLLRRCLLPVEGVVVKIAAVEDRSSFQIRHSTDSYTGLELGPDMSADLDLDDYMAFTRSPDQAKDFFGRLFLAHLQEMVPTRALLGAAPAQPGIGMVTRFVEHAFGRDAFVELVRAAEGIPRDAINVASLAAGKAGDGAILQTHIRSAARQWYLRDKERAALTHEPAGRLLKMLTDELIRRGMRAFFVESGIDDKHPLLRYLYDARVVHLLASDVAADDQPGKRFSLFGLDYGAYVDAGVIAGASRLFRADSGEGVRWQSAPQSRYKSINVSRIAIKPLEWKIANERRTFRDT